MLIQEIIRKKRDGAALSDGDLHAFIAGVTDHSVSDAQIAAFTMAVCLRGMSADETARLTVAMRDSGTVLKWDDVARPVADKHSTGGVGDCVSIALAPIVAAAGLAVPMISGRGLGHSGGTLDKLDSIPGYDTAPAPETFARVVREVGCAVIGQTGDLAPADKRIYAVRDSSGTVESTPLITASILSKKLASGIGALVMDVKCGNGAFAASDAAADELAASITATAHKLQLPAAALITDMNQPLAPVAGNALEVALAVRFLRGDERPPRFTEVVTALAQEMLFAGAAASRAQARSAVARVLASGAAAEVFAAMVRALGGAADFVDQFARQLPAAAVVCPVFAEEDGYVGGVDTRALGIAVIALGGGRRRAGDAIDYSVGLGGIAALGEAVDRERPLATVHAGDAAAAERAAAEVRAAFRITEDAPPASPVVLRRLDGGVLSAPPAGGP